MTPFWKCRHPSIIIGPLGGGPECPLCGRNYNDLTHYRVHSFDRHFVQHFANDINLCLSYCQYAMVTVEKRQPGTFELRETLKGFVNFIDKKSHTELHLLTSIGKLNLLVNKFSVCNSKLYLILPLTTLLLLKFNIYI